MGNNEVTKRNDGPIYLAKKRDVRFKFVFFFSIYILITDD
jgi:hypothetical protein